jgi:molybdopterin-guanine dinucleotide biosynthesis protein A
MASIMEERHPEQSGPLTGFVEGLKHAREEFIQKVRSDVGSQAGTFV